MIIENKELADFASLVSSGEVHPFEGPLKVGVDLGTANIVMAVVDQTIVQWLECLFIPLLFVTALSLIMLRDTGLEKIKVDIRSKTRR